MPASAKTPSRRTKSPSIKRQSADEASQISLDPRAVLDSAISQHKNDVHKQVAFFFKHYPIPASQGRSRVVSAKTTSKYVLTVHSLLEALQQKGVKLHSLNELTGRQLLTVFRGWEAKGMSSSTLATYFSVLKRFYGWLGVRLAYASIHEVLVDPSRGKRSMSATKSRAWSANGVDFQAVLSKVHAIDDVVALQLEVVAAFGLRVLEACAMRPQECDRGNHLVVMYGAKGGRGRTVSIESHYQRTVLDKAKAFAQTHNGFLRKPGRTQKQAYKRFYNVLSAAGVNRSQLGVSAHGLRHEYANDLYTRLTGTESPVNHGQRIELEQDRSARKVITEALGHSRLPITSAYLGSHVQMDRHHKKRLASINAMLTMPGEAMQLYHQQIQRQARQQQAGIELRIFITGPAAEGKEIHGVPVVMAAGFFEPNGMPSALKISESDLQKLATACQEAIGLWSVGHHEQAIPADVPRFELMYPEQ